MKMVSMKMKKRQGEDQPESISMEQPEYPYGLQISLEKEQLDALGMSGLPMVGETMTMMCEVKVIRCSEEDMKGEDKRRSCSLQITAMGMELPEKKGVDMKAAAAALYGGSMKKEA